MPLYDFLWTEWILEHVEEHGVTREEFEWVVQHPTRTGFSRRSGRPTAHGYTPEGRYLYCVFDRIDELTV